MNTLVHRAAGGMVAVAFLAVAMPVSAAETLVAVAANFAEVVDELEPLFEQTTGHELSTTTGSTGKLYAQISAGAPFEVMLSADAGTPARLEEEGAGVAGTRFTYALGRLTLWSADSGRIGGDGKAALLAGDVRHIAIANPALAPYGAAAVEVLRNLGLWASLKVRIVMGQNVGQTHAMVATGNAELGFVALAAVLSPRRQEKGSRWDVPQALYEPIRQDAILLRPGYDKAAARAFLDFLKSPQALAVIERYGYGIV